MNSIEVENRYTSGVYPKRPVAIVQGEGARVWDETGQEYIDCVGGHGVAIVGHANPAVVAAIEQQARRLITCPVSSQTRAPSPCTMATGRLG